MKPHQFQKKKIALVHDFLLYWGGAERVLKGFTEIFPQAPVFTLFYKKNIAEKFFPGTTIKSLLSLPSFLPHRLMLPFLPTAVESLILDDYDIVISSGVFSKGIITKPGTLHIHYCHTPPRFLWEERNEYVAHNVPFGLKSSARFLSHWLRVWDRQAGEQRVDYFIANSNHTKERIKKIYGREAEVIYPFVKNPKPNPPAGGQNPKPQVKIKKYFLVISRLQRYKNIELPIKVFNTLQLPLYIVGEGRDRKRLKRMAGKNIIFLGFKKEEDLPLLYKHARALIVPGIEDFGLTAIEAMAEGTPVFAYKKGGAKETIKEGKTGEFFDELTPASFYQGLQRFLVNENKYKKTRIIAHAKKFSYEKFKKHIISIVNEETMR